MLDAQSMLYFRPDQHGCVSVPKLRCLCTVKFPKWLKRPSEITDLGYNRMADKISEPSLEPQPTNNIHRNFLLQKQCVLFNHELHSPCRNASSFYGSSLIVNRDKKKTEY